MIRELAYDLLFRVETEDAYANLLLPTLLSRAKVDTRDAGFIQELAFGVIRNKSLYQKIIEKASGRTQENIDIETSIVLWMGVHQLLGMRVPSHAAINETVELAKRKCNRGAVGFVNAVLRKISAKDKSEWVSSVCQGLDKQQVLAITTSHPEWIVGALRTALSSRSLENSLEELLDSHQNPAKVSIVALPGLANISEVASVIPESQVSPIGAAVEGNPSLILEVQKGTARVQDQGSQLVALALVEAEIATDETVWLDLCAGPGGKAALLASLANQKSINIVCNESSTHRSKLVKDALANMNNATLMVSDGREIGQQGARYSRILVDAPCTGLGALRRRPEARWRKSPEDLRQLSQLQRELLDSAWRALLPGGVLAYVTCSPHLSETTAQVAWFESQHSSEMELLNSNTILNRVSPSLDLDESFRTTQLWPHLNETDGMFLALFRKSVG